MYYDGIYNKIYIGRNKGWEVTQTEISGNFTMVGPSIFNLDAALVHNWDATDKSAAAVGARFWSRQERGWQRRTSTL